jgi:CDP-diacylglycerol--glycerol-3-phosphate 3-phosphatidyltransferase
VIKSVMGERLDAWIHALFPFLFTRRLNPNALTVAGAILSMVAAVAFARGSFVIGGVLILVGGFFDLVDGVVARHQGVATRFGAFLDSTLDRLVDMALLLGIAMHFALVSEPYLVLLAGYTLISSVLVSYAQARAQLFFPAFSVGLLERGERVGILAAGAILGWMVPALWLLAVGSTVTVIQRFIHAYRELERMDAEERDAVVGGPV